MTKVTLIKVYLQGEAGLTNHAMVQLPIETVEDYELLERNGHIYRFSSFQAGSAFYLEVQQPLHISE